LGAEALLAGCRVADEEARPGVRRGRHEVGEPFAVGRHAGRLAGERGREVVELLAGGDVVEAQAVVAQLAVERLAGPALENERLAAWREADEAVDAAFVEAAQLLAGPHLDDSNPIAEKCPGQLAVGREPPRPRGRRRLDGGQLAAGGDV